MQILSVDRLNLSDKALLKLKSLHYELPRHCCRISNHVERQVSDLQQELCKAILVKLIDVLLLCLAENVEVDELRYVGNILSQSLGGFLLKIEV